MILPGGGREGCLNNTNRKLLISYVLVSDPQLIDNGSCNARAKTQV